jgi:hypothetical protein
MKLRFNFDCSENIIDGYYMPTMNNIFDNIANRVQVSPKDMSISTFPPLKFTLYLQNSSGQLEVCSSYQS